MNSMRAGTSPERRRRVRVGMTLGILVGAVLGGAGASWWHQQRCPLLGCGLGDHAHAEERGAAGPADHCAGHDEDQHGGELSQRSVTLSEQAVRDAGIELSEAVGGELEHTLTLPGQIALNADRVAHIVPRVSGIVLRVDKNLGDEVRAGEVLAVLQSRELAEAKAAYLVGRQKLALAEANLASAALLRKQKIMPDLEFLAVEKARAEAAIELSASETKLHALGLADEQLRALSDSGDDPAFYELRAPFAGTVIEKHCALGELLDSQSDAFVLADLSAVWADITVYGQHITRVQVGQPVRIQADGLNLTAEGTISYVTPFLDQATRSVCARLELPNPQGRWRPGTFFTAVVTCERWPAAVLVPAEAVLRVDQERVVFVGDGCCFTPRPVSIGRTSTTHAEIVAGLQPGEQYVSRGAALLKAELTRGAAGADACCP